MSYITINTDVDVDIYISDIINDKYDRVSILEALLEDEYLPENSIITSDGYVEYGNNMKKSLNTGTDTEQALSILQNHAWKMTKEEEDVIKSIAEKYKHV